MPFPTVPIELDQIAAVVVQADEVGGVLQLPDAPRQPDRPIEMAVNHRVQRDAIEQAIAVPGAEVIER